MHRFRVGDQASNERRYRLALLSSVVCCPGLRLVVFKNKQILASDATCISAEFSVFVCSMVC